MIKNELFSLRGYGRRIFSDDMARYIVKCAGKMGKDDESAVSMEDLRKRHNLFLDSFTEIGVFVKLSIRFGSPSKYRIAEPRS